MELDSNSLLFMFVSICHSLVNGLQQNLLLFDYTRISEIIMVLWRSFFMKIHVDESALPSQAWRSPGRVYQCPWWCHSLGAKLDPERMPTYEWHQYELSKCLRIYRYVHGSRDQFVPIFYLLSCFQWKKKIQWSWEIEGIQEDLEELIKL